MGTPSIEELETAAEWLDTYDHDGSRNHEHCQRVRVWLLEEAKRKAVKAAEAEAIRQHAARIGRTPGEVRKALARVRAKNNPGRRPTSTKGE
jgi:hypothetical protein